jgi:hypothetical protein
LVWMEESYGARATLFGLILVALPGIVRFGASSSSRVALCTAWFFSLAYVIPHSLVDPRYYIMPMVFLQFFSTFQRRQARQLTVWYAMLTAAVLAYVVQFGRRGGGIW